MLIALLALALAAPLLAPANPIEPLDPVAGRHLAPGSQRIEVRLADGSSILAERARTVDRGLEIERLGETRQLASEDLASPVPSEALRKRYFLFGTDRFGRDLTSRLLVGGRTSLAIALVATALALTLGLMVGAIAGTAGAAVDAALMRLTDALLAFPNLLIAIALVSLLDAGAATIVVVLGATGWMATARLTRAELLGLREREFVLAAGAIGQTPTRVLWRHLLPNALTPVIAHTALRIGDLILVEASLSFLGLGVAPPHPTWGNMIADGRDALTTAWWVATLPGLAIAVTVISFHLLGDGLRARLDPRSR